MNTTDLEFSVGSSTTDDLTVSVFDQSEPEVPVAQATVPAGTSTTLSYDWFRPCGILTERDLMVQVADDAGPLFPNVNSYSFTMTTGE